LSIVLVNGRTARVTAIFTPGSTARLDPSVTGESTPASAPTVPVGQVSLPLSETGEVSESVTVRTGDGAGSLTIGKGTVARGGDGNPLGEVTIKRADAAGLPPVPPGTTIGATFDPPATLTYTLSGEEWGRIGDLATLRVSGTTPGPGATRTVTAEVSHFSLFALTWAAAPPGWGTTAGTAGV